MLLNHRIWYNYCIKDKFNSNWKGFSLFRIHIVNSSCFNNSEKFSDLLCMCDSSKMLTYEFDEYIKDFESFEVLNSLNCYRKIYRDVISEGISVLEQNKDLKALEESQELIEEILRISEKK